MLRRGRISPGGSRATAPSVVSRGERIATAVSGRRRHAARAFIAFVLLVPALALPGVALASPEPPSRDPFYRPPADLASLKPGAIIRSRTVQIDDAPLAAFGVHAYQLLYRTEGNAGQAVAAATTVIVPRGARPKGGRQLVSLEDAENSDSSTCAPSYQLRTGGTNSFIDAELSGVTTELEAGRDIVVHDALGPESEFLATGMEGHATLDSLRAVEDFRPAELNGTRTRIGLVGYSEGAHQAVAAAQLAPRYAPELRIVGVAAGGVPVGNVQSLSYLAESAPANVLQVMTGINRAFPALDWPALLNAKGRAASAQMSTCNVVEVLNGPSGPMSAWTKAPNVFGVPRVEKVLSENALGHRTPSAPLYVFIGTQDEEISKPALDALVRRYCAAGATVDYYVDPDGHEHFQSATLFFPLANDYLGDRFAGDKAPDTCAAPGRHLGRVVLRTRHARLRRRHVALRLTCAGAIDARCAGRISIHIRTLACGSERFSAAAPRTRKIEIPLRSGCLKRILRDRRGKVTVTIQGRFTTQRETLRKRITLRT